MCYCVNREKNQINKKLSNDAKNNTVIATVDSNKLLSYTAKCLT